MTVIEEQNEICNDHGVEVLISEVYKKLGIAKSILGKTPINGLRHPIENGTYGCYFWCGEELSEDPEFFDMLHVKHFRRILLKSKNIWHYPLASGFCCRWKWKYLAWWINTKRRPKYSTRPIIAMRFLVGWIWSLKRGSGLKNLTSPGEGISEVQIFRLFSFQHML